MTNMFSRIVNYLKETRSEMHKVNWPTMKQTIQSTLVVIAISIGIAFYLGVFDYVYRTLLQTFVF
ncbi:MAG: preprotein translocase subunit SecE [Candidatus Ryanbacteria bacterium RIFCSPHIGHO2_12_FULL_47_12b]|uniref:Protein translocase subunit SecE n=2 Tax=Candidatus Ryaniibacteriota TaxID=1817914 RepID=A0A1G2H4X8_9BACT|nr:MAG: Preprotein translocase, SecE subunit [Parcubacteria group bacterium GW2011_GWA1_47_9]OGZ44219.1 MAG: preprotein translocase subunit SecE [Candidatus Ryanbacteria bacterium RIFCSPHIGHO2_01_FULL_48_80]OGZ48360.1 MAG: preprotein translocase subunit SecE [Candidatus Ryanbacteria bacterium RIFCSPHIGHO2_02_FULL_47_25]OGZ52612.1 MAG: preprotein translocase subunit SecE [Candidatus Ryanbacteria bacterium RIFCSPHIGHO2_12_FULL_47_12b]OGZ56859.1 MAG: preprotein translocase subunit SecE [Candidatus